METLRVDDVPEEKEEDMRHYHFKPKAYNIKNKTLTKHNDHADDFTQKILEK